MVEEDLQIIQDGIRQKGYQWEAGATALSELSLDQAKEYLGLLVEEAELEAMAQAIEAETKAQEKAQAFMAPVTAPAAVDWRNKNGDWTTSVKNQGNCGSCVAFATVATLESRINIVCRKPNLDKDLSEAHLFYCGCGSCCKRGWNFPPALDFCKNTGVGLETSFPYTPGDQPCKQGVPTYVKITGWTAVKTIADRKNVLATKGPMVGGMAVYSDFFSYRSGVYRHVTGSLAGYHAISVVGYNDQQECWICKNSWGTGWGENGWFRIGYGECLIDKNFPFYDMDVRCPEPIEHPCARWRKVARRYYELYRRTRKLHYLCMYYRYAATYFCCMYRATKNRRYLCQCYRYLAAYYHCLYVATRNRRYLTLAQRYIAAYRRCIKR